jgi:ankyrin repeat protein
MKHTLYIVVLLLFSGMSAMERAVGFVLTELAVPTDLDKQLLAAARNHQTSQRIAGYIKKGAYIDVQNEEGDTPLHIAAREGHGKVVEFLLESDASLSYRNNAGQTAYECAAENVRHLFTGEEEVVAEILVDLHESSGSDDHQQGKKRKRDSDDVRLQKRPRLEEEREIKDHNREEEPDEDQEILEGELVEDPVSPPSVLYGMAFGSQSFTGTLVPWEGPRPPLPGSGNNSTPAVRRPILRRPIPPAESPMGNRGISIRPPVQESGNGSIRPSGAVVSGSLPPSLEGGPLMAQVSPIPQVHGPGNGSALEPGRQILPSASLTSEIIDLRSSGTPNGSGRIAGEAGRVPLAAPAQPVGDALAPGHALQGELQIADVDFIDVNARVNGLTALQRFLFRDIRIVRRLLERGANVDVEYAIGTSLHFAVCKNNLELVNLLLEHHAQINKKGAKGCTPLRVACGSANIDIRIVRRLLDSGAAVDVEGDGGQTPLYAAACSNNLAAVNLLLEFHAQVDKGRFTPLMIAARNSSLPIIARLLEAGASTTLRDERGKTYLDYLSPDLQLLVKALAARK